MSRPPHREKDAKVEGRDPLEKAKGTMGPFKVLMGRLLRVPMNEVEEQQRLYETEIAVQKASPTGKLKKRARLTSTLTQAVSLDKAKQLGEQK